MVILIGCARMICQRILAGNEKKKTVSKTLDHEKKKTRITNKEKYQNKVLPGKIKLKKIMERKRTATMMIFLKKKQSHAAPEITKEKGMHDREDEVQVIKETCEKKSCGWGGNGY
jgi:hypothetical protein